MADLCECCKKKPARRKIQDRDGEVFARVCAACAREFIKFMAEGFDHRSWVMAGRPRPGKTPRFVGERGELGAIEGEND